MSRGVSAVLIRGLSIAGLGSRFNRAEGVPTGLLAQSDPGSEVPILCISENVWPSIGNMKKSFPLDLLEFWPRIASKDVR